MSMHKLRVLLLTLSIALFAAGCKKPVKTAATVPPPPPPPTTPDRTPPAARPSVVRFDAEPTSVDAGQSVTLRWEVTNADNVAIAPGVGGVQATGTTTVRPNTTTTYVLTATGTSGTSASASVTVNVTSAPPPPPPDNNSNSRGTFTERLGREVQDVFFAYDQSGISPEAQATLTRDADALKSILSAFQGQSVMIEGHCDERGSAEYNLGLGDRRASAVRDFLGQLGVPVDRLKTVSYGKEKPQCTEAAESCYSSNRRAHFAGQ